jgi:hypothetical protein
MKARGALGSIEAAPMSRLAIALTLVALALTGCYGNTTPATNLKPDGATLNAKGTANNGPAFSYFEYWKAATPNDKTRTPTRHWPAGASGPFSESIGGGVSPAPLLQNTAYEFRLCGGDDETKPAACVPSRPFTTSRGDAVDGQQPTNPQPWESPVFINAWSGPSGESARGTVSGGRAGTGGGFFDLTVNCLVVHGNAAAIGGVGTASSPEAPQGVPASMLIELETTADPAVAYLDTNGGLQLGPVPGAPAPTPECPADPSATHPADRPSFVIQDG